MITKNAIVGVGLVCLISSAGCGYIGEPQYPALNVPNRVSDLSVTERGDHLEVNFTVAPLTTEGLILKAVGPVDLRVGSYASRDFHVEAWAESAVRVNVAPPQKPGPVHVTVPVNQFVGKEVIVAVRVANARGRTSEWSNLVTVRVEPPIATPSDFMATPGPQGVLLRWTAPKGSFRIYRNSGKEPQPAPIGNSEQAEYLDSTAVYGMTYDYFVQAVNGQNESAIAGPVSVTNKDIFPPATPSGLAVTSGLNSIELTWDRNLEADFQGYNIYRAEGDGPIQRVAEFINAPNFSDKKIESGKRYRYSVSALDKLGNESAKSQVVEITAP